MAMVIARAAVVLALEALGVGLLLVALAVGQAAQFIALVAAVAAGTIALRRYTRAHARVAEAFRAHPRVAWAGLAIAMLAFPLFQLHSPFWIHTMAVAGIYVIMALGLNVVVGFAGLLDLGFVAFYAIGAYTSALLTVHAHLSFWVTMPAAALVALAFGALLGVPTLRLRGDYLALVTLGFGEIVRLLVNNLDWLTQGPSGISGIAAPSIGDFVFSRPSSLFGLTIPPQAHYYYLVVALAAVTVFIVRRLNDSRIGRAWNGIREDEIAASVFGVDVPRTKLLAFGSGALFGGVAGAVFANMNTYVSPDSFIFFQSVIVLCMVIFGGMGNVPGVVLGALVLTVLPERLREFEHFRILVFGAALTTLMVFRPEGILPNERRRRELHAPEPAESVAPTAR